MVKVAGMIRLMGMERFERLVTDLYYCRKMFKETVQRYAASSFSLPEKSAFKIFVKEPDLKGIPIVDNEQKLEKLLLGEYPLYDRTKISLSDLILYRERKYLWGNTPTREGRTMLVQAFTNFQKVMVVYFGMNYETCCDEVLNVLEENMDVLRKFNDSYLQVRFEMVLSRFFQDV